MTDSQAKLLDAIKDMWQRYPDWRLGQIICNVADWINEPTDPQNSSSIWQLEDEELTRGIRQHLARREQQNGSQRPTNEQTQVG